MLRRCHASVVPAIIVGLLTTIATADEPAVETIVQQNINENFEQLGKSNQPSMLWDATTVAEHEAWQAKFHDKMIQLLGRMPQRVPLEVKWESEAQ